MKVAIYTRVSTEDQAKEGYSLEVQREYLESFAKREGLEIFKVYQDDGISGYSTERPALKGLLKDAKEKRFDLVLVYKIDRFSRNLKDLLNLVDELSSSGIGFKDRNGKKILVIGKDIKKLFNSSILIVYSHNASPPNLVLQNRLNIDNSLISFFEKTSFNYQNIWSEFCNAREV